MHILDKDLKTIHEALKEGKVTSKELLEESLRRAKKYQIPYNNFVTILEDAKENSVTENILSGIPYALKDNFSTSGILTTASSNILSNYVPVYDSTVYRKLKESGAVLMGKAVLDELAMGGTGTTAHTGIVRNPWDENRMIGGSSSGSAGAVALGIVPYSIGSDTGDSVRKPAGYAGVVGYKPTYGLISRFGLFAFAASLDHVGIFTRGVKDVAYVLDTLKGEDEHDMTSYEAGINFAENITDNVKGKKLFYLKEIIEPLKNNEKVYNNFMEIIEKAKNIGMEIYEESVDKAIFSAIYPAYISISCAEATSNNSNLTGIVFGNRQDGKNVDEIMFNTRTNGFSELIKRRFIMGSFILQRENQEALFKNAQRVRRLIVDKINELFEKYDGLILPNAGSIAPRFDEQIDRLSEEYLLLENHLVIGNFGGFPSITIPSGLIDNMPVAINITGKPKNDLEVLNMAYALEKEIGFKYLNEYLAERGEN